MVLQKEHRFWNLGSGPAFSREQLCDSRPLTQVSSSEKRKSYHISFVPNMLF